MITIKELATELGVSKQAVYNRVTKEPLKSTLADMDKAIETSSQGTIFLSDEAATVIKNAYKEKYQKPGEQAGQNRFGRTSISSSSDVKFDTLLSQVSDIQILMQNITECLHNQSQTNDTIIEELQVIMRAKDMQISELVGRIKTLEDLLAAKDTKIEQVQSSYTSMEEQLRDLHAQVQSLESKLNSGKNITEDNYHTSNNVNKEDDKEIISDTIEIEDIRVVKQEAEITTIPKEEHEINKNLSVNILGKDMMSFGKGVRLAALAKAANDSAKLQTAIESEDVVQDDLMNSASDDVSDNVAVHVAPSGEFVERTVTKKIPMAPLRVDTMQGIYDSIRNLLN